MKIALVGKGKMGNCVVESLGEDDQLACWVSRGKIPHIACDVLIDFSSADMIENIYDYCVNTNTCAVIATTGYNDSQFALIKELSCKVAVFYCANMSFGIRLISSCVESIKNSLDSCNLSADINIIEKHHKFKKDSPSGTAKMLANLLNENVKPLSIRAGTYIGEHEIIFDLLGEQISLKHTALNRNIFALGALTYAKLLKNKPPALYSPKDLL